VAPLSGYAAACIAVADRLTRGRHRPLGQPATVVSDRYQDVAFFSRVDRLRLSGWLFAAEASTHQAGRQPFNPGSRAAILVHGYNWNRVNEDYGAMDLARDLLSAGYDVLTFDLRSCGLSQGGRFTLGHLEVRDLLGAYDFMVGRGYRPGRMAVIGDSMGAATMLCAAPWLRQVGALVADSCFARLRPLLERSVPASSHLPAFFNPGIFLAGRLFFGLDADLSPLAIVRGLPERAFLFIHGTADDYVAPSNSEKLKEASANPDSRLCLIPGARHVQGYKQDPGAYLEVLLPFLESQLK
jgi:pimeloyl-ACP methyl ester carboxylesterase